MNVLIVVGSIATYLLMGTFTSAVTLRKFGVQTYDEKWHFDSDAIGWASIFGIFWPIISVGLICWCVLKYPSMFFVWVLDCLEKRAKDRKRSKNLPRAKVL